MNILDAEEGPKQTEVTGEYLDVETNRAWRGKTGGYFRNETAILKILDRDDNEVTGIWSKDWQESAPGIETRGCDEDTAVLKVGRSYETHRDRRVRIHRGACPVSIQFVETDEYVDYDNAEYSSHHRRVYWVRYVA